MRINRQTAVSRCRLSTLTVRAASDGQAAAETAEPQSASFEASLVSKNSVVVPDSELSITKTSFGTIGLTVGLLLLSYGFGAYFQFLPGSESSALMLTYGFPTALIGFALKYAELKPVPCTSYADAVALREAQATPILQQVRSDVTRFRYGDEQHLEEALKRIFRYNLSGGIQRRNAPTLTSISEQVYNGQYSLVLIFEAPALSKTDFMERQAKFTSFFGPGVQALIEESASFRGGMEVAGPRRAGVRRVEEGERVVVYEARDAMRIATVTPTRSLQNRFGVFRHSEWVGQPVGSRVRAVKGGGFVHLLAPSPALWTKVLPHRTQILYLPDIALIIARLAVTPGATVLESGTGSGSLSHSLARAVAPTGRLLSFDFHHARAEQARAEFEANGIAGVASVQVRDIQGHGFPPHLHASAHATFLDLPSPWLALPSAAACLLPGGRLCSFSPCMEQVQRCSHAMRAHGLT
ncbi:unnamed protein product, partial [Closterium sp. Naga37s-1]